MSTEGGTHAPRRFQTPSHLDAPDKFQLGWLTFTPRQAGIMLIGLLSAYLVWKSLAFLQLAHLEVLRVGVSLLLLPGFLVLATFRLEQRYLESWFLVFLEYRLSPHAYVWRHLPPSLDPRLEPAEGAPEQKAEEAR